MSENVITFTGFAAKRGTAVAPRTERESSAPQEVEWRERDQVLWDIERHKEARRAHGQAVAWEIAAVDQNLPQSQIEEARKRAAAAYSDLQDRGRYLVAVMPTDPKALVDLLMYLEKNFSILPQELVGRSLAFDLVRTMRLSLRRIVRCRDDGRRP